MMFSPTTRACRNRTHPSKPGEILPSNGVKIESNSEEAKPRVKAEQDGELKGECKDEDVKEECKDEEMEECCAAFCVSSPRCIWLIGHVWIMCLYTCKK